MAEIRNDMLPEESQTSGPTASEVTQEVTPPEEVVVEVPVVVPTPKPVVKEVKTPPNELLGALHEERKLRKAAEDKLAQLQTTPDDIMSDEGRLLKAEIDRLNAKIADKEAKEAEQEVFNAYPQLNEHKEAFEAFRGEAIYQGLPLSTIAKAFVVEKDLVGKPRKGLEKATGGSKGPVQAGLTPADTERLRTTQPKLYLEMLRTGQLNPDNIKY